MANWRLLDRLETWRNRVAQLQWMWAVSKASASSDASADVPMTAIVLQQPRRAYRCGRLPCAVAPLCERKEDVVNDVGDHLYCAKNESVPGQAAPANAGRIPDVAIRSRFRASTAIRIITGINGTMNPFKLTCTLAESFVRLWLSEQVGMINYRRSSSNVMSVALEPWPPPPHRWQAIADHRQQGISPFASC